MMVRPNVCFSSMFYHWLQFSVEADCLFVAINHNYELCFRSGILNVLFFKTISLGVYWSTSRVWITLCERVLDDCFRICTVVESANFYKVHVWFLRFSFFKKNNIKMILLHGLLYYHLLLLLWENVYFQNWCTCYAQDCRMGMLPFEFSYLLVRCFGLKLIFPWELFVLYWRQSCQCFCAVRRGPAAVPRLCWPKQTWNQLISCW